MKLVFTSSRSSSIVSRTDWSGGYAAITGSIIRPIVSFGNAALRCHWRARSPLAAENARSRASVGKASSTSWANPGLRRASVAAIGPPGESLSFAAAPVAERLFKSSPKSGMRFWVIASFIAAIFWSPCLLHHHGTILL